VTLREAEHVESIASRGVTHTIGLAEDVSYQAYLEWNDDIHDPFNHQTERYAYIEKLQAWLIRRPEKREQHLHLELVWVTSE